MKRILTFLSAFCLSLSLFAQGASIDSLRCQPDESVAFAQYDTLALEMDFYFPPDDAESHPCIIYSYGGGFVTDNQRHFETRQLCRMLADDGFVVVATNYRLGLRGVQFKGVGGMVKPLEKAIQLATEDVMKVTRHILTYATELTVDPEQLILMGSSAGAITSLQCDFERAIFSRSGLDYEYDTPAPTLFLHGTADQLVTYEQVKLFGIGFYGSDRVARQFAKKHYPYMIMRFTDEGHSVAARYFTNYEHIGWFIENMVLGGRRYEIDMTIFNPDREKPAWDNYDPGSLYQ